MRNIIIENSNNVLHIYSLLIETPSIRSKGHNFGIPETLN